MTVHRALHLSPRGPTARGPGFGLITVSLRRTRALFFLPIKACVVLIFFNQLKWRHLNAAPALLTSLSLPACSHTPRLYPPTQHKHVPPRRVFIGVRKELQSDPFACGALPSTRRYVLSHPVLTRQLLLQTCSLPAVPVDSRRACAHAKRWY